MLVTWVFCIGLLIATGLLPVVALSRGRLDGGSIRAALWWGLLTLTIALILVSLALPLRSAAAAAIVLSVVVVVGGIGAVVVRRRGFAWTSVRRSWWWALGAALGLATIFLAASALGPVTNYDTGLYHLGAIGYAGDYATIAGLANLYFPLGYANAEFPLAAFLGNGPWDGVGYRLLNGLLLGLVALDLLVRARERRLTAGFFVLAVGVAAAWVPMVALADYWVTSPTSDSAVLALTLASTAYLVDAVSSDRRWWRDAGTSVAAATLAVMLRPTMVVFAVALVAVLVVSAWHRRNRVKEHRSMLAPVVVGGAVVLAGIATSVRDYVLSGWLQFPLSVHAFDVGWLAADPTDVRLATLGNARDPLDLWAAATGWGWVGAWLRRLPEQWELFEVFALALAAIVLTVLAARSRTGLRTRAMLLAMVPSLVAVGFWWLATPPAFRFIWGPLFTALTIPAGWALWRLATNRSASRASRRSWQWLTVAGVAFPVVLVTAFSAVARFDAATITEGRTWTLGVRIPYAVTPITHAEVSEQQLPSGLRILVPTQSDQCWDAYPLCSPMAPSTLSLRGSTIGEGFLP